MDLADVFQKFLGLEYECPDPFRLVNPTMPHFPDEVLVHIFSFLSVRHTRTARLVCRRWWRLLDANAALLWERRCKSLGLLPTIGWGVLHASAEYTRERVKELKRHKEDEREASLVLEVAKVYKAHFFIWAHHLCRCTRINPALLTTMCPKCVHLSKCGWRNVPNSDVLRSRRRKGYVLRTFRCPLDSRPPYKFVFEGRMLRIDDYTSMLVCEHGEMATDVLAARFVYGSCFLVL